MRCWLKLALLVFVMSLVTTQTNASNLFGVINSICIGTIFPELPDAQKISDAGFTQLQAIPAHPSGSWNTADQGWPTVFGQDNIRFRLRKETVLVNEENFEGFVCEINELDEQIESLNREMLANYGEPQSSVLGDGYAEHYWSLGGKKGERREVVIDTMSNSLTYHSFKKRN